MNEDFFSALLTGILILLFFWLTIVLFIYFRKPPNSKLTIKIFYNSITVFLILIFILFLFR